MTDFLKDQLAAMDKRLRELRPAYDEYQKIEQAKAALEGLGSPRRGPGRPRGSGGTRRRRRRSGGTRAEEALGLLRQNPGLSVRELSERMKIKHPNYLYRVLGQLESEGAVKKKGRGWEAA